MENDDFEKEIWLPIADFENLYQISNYGRVRSLPRNTTKGKIMKLDKNIDGYMCICLSKNNINKRMRVNRLVASAFIPNPNNLPQVNHINEIKTDNRVENLEWVTTKQNNNHGTHNEKIAKAKSKQVNQYDLAGNFIKTWESATEIERQLGFAQGNISNCCNGKRKSAYGFIWRFNES